METGATIQEIRDLVTDEVFRAFGFSADGRVRRLLGPLAWPATQRFAGLAAHFEETAAQESLPAAARWLLTEFVAGVQTCGTEQIPPDGPLLICSNHPGAYDSLVISSQVPRTDLKIVISHIPFLHRLPATARHLIGSSHNPHQRIITLRESIRHLQAGGALLIFPGGLLNPDPAFQPGAEEELENWSPSLAFLLRHAPQTRLLSTIVSGVLVPRFARHPAVLLRRGQHQRRLLAEFLQVIQQLLLARRYPITPRVSFGVPLEPADLGEDREPAAVMATIIGAARQVLTDHVAGDNC